MTTAGGDEALEASVLDKLGALTTELGRVAERLDSVASREKRTRRLSWVLAISFALDIILTVVVALLTVSAVNQASSIKSSQLAACAIGNATRADERALWGYLVQLSDKNPGTNQSELQKFDAFVNKTFAPVNCSQVYQ
jgi:hypothetical protein